MDQPHGSGRRSSNMCSSVPFGFDMALFKARLARSLQKSIALPKTHMDPGRMGPERWFFLYKPVVFRVHVSFPGTLCHCPCDPDSMNNGSWWSFRSQTLDDPCTSASRFQCIPGETSSAPGHAPSSKALRHAGFGVVFHRVDGDGHGLFFVSGGSRATRNLDHDRYRLERC